jgi:hypothetical protein
MFTSINWNQSEIDQKARESANLKRQEKLAHQAAVLLVIFKDDAILTEEHKEALKYMGFTNYKDELIIKGGDVAREYIASYIHRLFKILKEEYM